MRGLGILTVALALFAFGGSSTSQGEEPGATVSEQGEESEVETGSIDWSAVREQRRSARFERGEVATVRFAGEFVGGGLPSAPTQAIPLDRHDIWFVLTVSINRVLEGQLPEGWTSSVSFGVHSPALLFGLQGIETAAGQHIPEGRFLLTLWRAPDGQYDLEIEPED